MVEADELMNEVAIFFEVLSATKEAGGYNEHVAKYNVDAGDHCLYTSKVKANEVRQITSICTKATNCTPGSVTLALGNMHNVYELAQRQNPAADELICQKGLWLRYEGDYAQACFTSVPAGCDLHLYVSGSQKFFPVIGWTLTPPPLIEPPPEEPAAPYWAGRTSTSALAGMTMIAFAIGTDIYAGTGYTGTELTDTFWKYDTLTNQWTAIDPLPGGGRETGIGFEAGGKGYAGLGKDSLSLLLTDFYELDPATGSWTAIDDYPGVGTKFNTGFGAGGKGYCGLGSNQTVNGKDFWRLNTASGTWTQIDDFPGVGRHGAIGVTVGGKGYVGLGMDYFVSPSVFYTDLYELDPATEAWVQMQSFEYMPPAHSIAFALKGLIFVSTGYLTWPEDAAMSNVTFVMNPTANAWTVLGYFPGAKRAYGVGAATANKGFGGFGWDGTSVLHSWFELVTE